MMTEILLDVTDNEIRHVAEEVLQRETSKQGVYALRQVHFDTKSYTKSLSETSAKTSCSISTQTRFVSPPHQLCDHTT